MFCHAPAPGPSPETDAALPGDVRAAAESEAESEARPGPGGEAGAAPEARPLRARRPLPLHLPQRPPLAADVVPGEYQPAG